jgi:hypothetical protein
LSNKAIIWTEGKTDILHLSRAKQALKLESEITFKNLEVDMGDDQLLKQCNAMSLTTQDQVTIFVFDRDNPDMVQKIQGEKTTYKSCG